METQPSSETATSTKSALIEPLEGRKRMPFEDMAYAKFGAAMSKKQIKHWNKIRSEMWSLADYILDRSRLHDFDKKADRLRSLIEQLPCFDADGKGFTRTGKAIEDF